MNNNNENQLEETGIEVITDILKVSHVELSDAIINNVKEGKSDPLQVHLALKKLEKVSEIVKKDETVKDLTLEEADKYLIKSNTFDYQNAKITKGSVHTYYDFNITGCPYYLQLVKIQKDVKELIKLREAELKLLIPKSNSLLIDKHTEVINHMPLFELTDYGEDADIKPPIKMQKTGLKVTFKK